MKQPSNPVPVTHSLPYRSRIAILSSLSGVTLLAWLYLVAMAWSMEGAPLTAADMVRVRPWTVLDFFLMFLMWAVMMVGMMVPTAMP